MPIVIIAIIIILVIVYKVKKNKAEFAKFQERKTQWEKAVTDRKKSGEPSVCEKIPEFDKPAKKDAYTGPDGKIYPKAMMEQYYFSVIYDFFHKGSEEFGNNKYETSPVFCMAAMQYYVQNYFYGGLDYMKPDSVTQNHMDLGLNCIYELAENYAYASMSDRDMTQAEHYTVRRLKDRKRAMEGNGFYKNVYEIPANAEKALNFYEMMEKIRKKYPEYFNRAGVEFVDVMSRCWLQAAHIYSAKQDVETAKGLYSQAFQIAVYHSKDEEIMEIIHAQSSCYPRKPEDYHVQVYNMLADWACVSDLGLAMYVEHMLKVKELDRARLGASPEEAVKYCIEQAENNHYAAYLLGCAMLYGYGTPKDEVHGRKILETAAENGCISSLYLLIQLSTGNAEEEKKWKEALDKSVAFLFEKTSAKALREELISEGKDVTRRKLGMS